MKNKLDVLFVHPNAAGKVYQDLSKDLSAIEPPIWAALLANHTRIKGYTTEILDCEAERQSPEESAKLISSKNPRLCVIVVYGQQPSASTQNMAGVRVLLEKIKDNCKTKTVLVGLHPSAL